VVRNSLNRLGKSDMNSIELSQWSDIIERTASQMCEDKNKI